MEPTAAPAYVPGDINQATLRLDKALAMLEARVRELAESQGGEVISDETRRLMDEYHAAKAKARTLEEAAQHAYEALGRAAERIRAIAEGQEVA